MGTNVKKLRRAAKRVAVVAEKAIKIEYDIVHPPEQMYICLRISANGEIKVQPRFERDKHDWITHNSTWRFGQALFVDGDYVNPDGGSHDWVYEYKDEIESHFDEARELLEANPIPVHWHLSEGRYYPPGLDFISSGSYMNDEIADMKSGPFKF